MIDPVTRDTITRLQGFLSHEFENFRKVDGWASVTLMGVWMEQAARKHHGHRGEPSWRAFLHSYFGREYHRPEIVHLLYTAMRCKFQHEAALVGFVTTEDERIEHLAPFDPDDPEPSAWFGRVDVLKQDMAEAWEQMRERLDSDERYALEVAARSTNVVTPMVLRTPYGPIIAATASPLPGTDYGAAVGWPRPPRPEELPPTGD